MTDKRNVPEIRVRGFDGEWSDKSYSKLFAVVPNNSLSRAGLNNKYGIAKNIHYGDVLIKYGEVIDAQKTNIPYINDSCFVDKCISAKLINGDVIIADAAEDESVGKCSELKNIGDQIIFSGLHTIASRPIIPFATGYLGYYINSSSYHDQLLRLMQGTKVLSVSKSALQDTIINYPLELLEQSQIGSYFQNLDSLITLHQRKYDKLITVKKAMLQKLFPKDGADVPEIRFKGFTDKWEKRKMGEITTPFAEPLPTPKDGYWRLGIRSHAKGTFHSFVQPGRELETAKMHKVRANNFIVNITFAWEHAVAITDGIDDGKLVSHRFPQFSFNEGMIPEYFKYLIIDERFKYHLWLSSPGGAGRNRVLKINEMLEYPFWVSNQAEQSKIAKYFQNLDSLITLQQRELDKLKNIKKACLEKMFV